MEEIALITPTPEQHYRQMTFWNIFMDNLLPQLIDNRIGLTDVLFAPPYDMLGVSRIANWCLKW